MDNWDKQSWRFSWPDCGEIDLMEQSGNNAIIGGNSHLKLHQGVKELMEWYARADHFYTFHNYQLLWNKSKSATGSTTSLSARERFHPSAGQVCRISGAGLAFIPETGNLLRTGLLSQKSA
jgi:hypothetical protein